MEVSFDPGDLGALKSVGDEKQPDPGVVYDLLILGGGPAAMTAAVYAARKMMKVAVLTDEFGGQMGDTTEIENYMGFQMISGRELVEKFVEHMKSFNVPAAQGEKVKEVTHEGQVPPEGSYRTWHDGDRFKATLESGTAYTSQTVIMATGKRYKTLNIPGEKEFAGRGVSYCEICDAPFFKGKKVVVAGGGNSGFTAAMDLMRIAGDVTVINHSPGWKADRVLFDPVQKNPNVTLLDNHEIESIEGTTKVTAVHVVDNSSGEKKAIPADGVFVEIGGVPNSGPVRGLAKLTQYRELMIDCGCRTSVEGLFGAGDVTTVPYKQVVVSAGEGAKAALSAYEHLASRGML